MTETGITIDLLRWLGAAVVVGIPFARIFHRAGFSWAWALFSLAPMAMLILWTILATRKLRWREVP